MTLRLKLAFLSFLMSIPVCPALHAGSESGNGAMGVLLESGIPVRVQLYDFWEAEQTQRFHMFSFRRFFGFGHFTEDEIFKNRVTALSSRMAEIPFYGGNFMEIFRDTRKEILTYERHVRSACVTVGDSNHKAAPRNPGDAFQAIVTHPETREKPGEMCIHELFDKYAGPMDRAGATFHEVFLLMGKRYFGHTDSRATRHLNALLFSKAFRNYPISLLTEELIAFFNGRNSMRDSE